MLPVQSVGIDLWNGVNSFIIRYALHLACGTKWNLLNWHGCGFIDGINKKKQKHNKCVGNYKTYINKAEQQQNLINSNSRRDFTESQYYFSFHFYSLTKSMISFELIIIFCFLLIPIFRFEQYVAHDLEKMFSLAR